MYDLMSTASLSDLPKALNRETISCRLSWKLGRWLLDLGRASICRSENKIFKAVPNPWVCDTREAAIKTNKNKKIKFIFTKEALQANERH